MNENDFKATHPTFTIICDKCGGKDVYVDNRLGCAESCGMYGEVTLVCNECGNAVDIFDTCQ